MMEANKSNVFFPQKYYDDLNQRYVGNRTVRESESLPPKIQQNALPSSERTKFERIPSKSHQPTPSLILNETASGSKRRSSLIESEGSAGASRMNSITSMRSNSINSFHQIKPMDTEDVNGDGTKRKKHHNYAPVNRTESTDSIKVSYPPKKTFIQKWEVSEDGNIDEFEPLSNKQHSERLNENKASKGLFQKFRKTSNRMIARNKNGKRSGPAVNVQNPNVGLNDLQL